MLCRITDYRFSGGVAWIMSVLLKLGGMTCWGVVGRGSTDP